MLRHWPQHAAYQASAVNLQADNVINDRAGAERGVKLSSNFLSSVKREDKREEHYQIVLQVVGQTPNLQKHKRTKK